MCKIDQRRLGQSSPETSKVGAGVFAASIATMAKSASDQLLSLWLEILALSKWLRGAALNHA